VVSNRVVLHLGGEDGAGIVAVDGKTGRLAWRSTSDEAGYASPILANLGGQQRLVCFTRAGVKVLDPADGRLLAGFPWRSRQGASVNAATPIVGPAGILVTSSYNTGAALLRWSGTSLERVWADEEALSAHISTPVRRDGWYFGFHGRQEQGGSVRCFEGATGKMLWDSGRTGIGSVLLAGDRLVLMLESGELIQAEASGEGWKPLCRAQLLGSGVRAAPVLDGELFVARDRNRLFAYRIPRRAQ
jgi:outer membrane protein assembly factor BamB